MRPATENDVDEIVLLLKEQLYEPHGGDVGPHLASVLRECVSSDRHMSTVALAEGQIVGVMIGSYRIDIDYEARVGFVDAIAVREDLRRQGIGRALCRSLAEWGRRRGCTYLQVLNGNQQFFEGIGFREREVRYHQVALADIIA